MFPSLSRHALLVRNQEAIVLAIGDAVLKLAGKSGQLRALANQLAGIGTLAWSAFLEYSLPCSVQELRERSVRGCLGP